jgi:HD-like signal output (HDOD) protein
MAAVTSHHNPALQLPSDALLPFWRRSIATAFCAKAIARTRNMKHDYAYTAGLLHHCGELVLMLHPGLQLTTPEGNIL